MVVSSLTMENGLSVECGIAFLYRRVRWH